MHQLKPRNRRSSVPGRSSTPTHEPISPPAAAADYRHPLDYRHDATPLDYRGGGGSSSSRGGGGADSPPDVYSTRSLLASHQQHDTDERKSSPVSGGGLYVPAAAADVSGSSTSMSSPAAITPQGAAPAGLQFAPLNVSTFMTPGGLSGLLPSPLMSPAQAAFFAQAGLTSPTMLGGALSFMTSFPGHAASLGGASAASSKEVGQGKCLWHALCIDSIF